MKELVKTETIQAITIYAFLLVIFLVMIRYLIFSKDIENKGVAKIIGGLAVFIVALISQNPAVIGISLFIGGLIIASEEFMQKLAIIFRSESKDIGENLKPVSATPQEVKQKQQQEIQETIEIQNEILPKTKTAKKPTLFGDNLKEIIKYESHVKQYWKNIFGNKFETDIKIVDPKTGEEIILDGVLLGNKTQLIEYIFEIRVISSFQEIDKIIVSIQSRIRSLFPELPLVLSLISVNKLTEKEAKQIMLRNNKLLSISLFEVNNQQILQRV